jgi:hypothetical protein
VLLSYCVCMCRICWTHQEFHVDCCPLRVKLDNVCNLQSGCIYTWGGPWGTDAALPPPERSLSPAAAHHPFYCARIVFLSLKALVPRRICRPHLRCVHLTAALHGNTLAFAAGAHAISQKRNERILHREMRSSF